MVVKTSSMTAAFKRTDYIKSHPTLSADPPTEVGGGGRQRWVRRDPVTRDK